MSNPFDCSVSQYRIDSNGGLGPLVPATVGGLGPDMVVVSHWQ